MKPILLFIPHYIGSLKYFERIYPHLSDKYDIYFLLLSAKEKHFPSMVEYCRQKGFKYFEAGRISSSVLTKLPLGKKYLKTRNFRRDADKILSNYNIAKIICVNDNSIYLRYLLSQANKRGIDTAVIQWSLSYEYKEDKTMITRKKGFRGLAYKLLKPVYIKIRNFIYHLVLGKNLDFVKGVPGAGTARRLGVINTAALNFFLREGVDPSKISVIGYMDFHVAETTKNDLDCNTNLRFEVKSKYGLHPEKKRIMIFTSPYNTNIVDVFDDRGQVDFYDKIVSLVRKVFPSETHEIILKLHPLERKGIYEKTNKQ